MTKTKSGVIQQRGTTRHFLFSKTDTRHLEKKPLWLPDDDTKDLISHLSQRFGDKRFNDRVFNRLDAAAQFGMMAMRFDHALPDTGDKTDRRGSDWQNDVARLIDLWCQKADALWGPVLDGILGGFFPGKIASECLELARRFQKSLTEQVQLTVTIGIAAYPTADYEKHQIMDNARKALDHAAFFGPNSSVIFDAVSLNISGDQLYDKGDISGAIEEFKQALALDSSNVNVRNSLGVCYGVLGEHQHASEEFKTALELDAEEYMAVYNLGLIKLLSGQRDQAIELFIKANDLREDVFEVVFQTGKLYLEMEHFENAVTFLEQACRLAPQSVVAYRYLGDGYAALNQPDAAISAYKKSIKFNPNDAAAMSALGCLFDDQNENPEIALMFCRESVALSPENGLFRYRLGQLYSKQNRLEEALKEFKKAGFLGIDAAEDIKEIEDRLASRAAK